MRIFRLVFLILLVSSFTLVAAAQETPTPSGGCTLETVDGQVEIVGDMSACSLEDINDMYKFLEEQVAGGFDVVELPTPILVGKSGVWDVELYLGATDQHKQIAMELGQLTIDPVTWSGPFNVDTAGYSSRNGFEYDASQGSNSLCEQKAPCSLIVNPSYFRLTSADGVIPSLGWKCNIREVSVLGCAVSIWQVGDAANLPSRFENGFSMTGQYFNGGTLVDGEGNPLPDGKQALPIAMNALMSLAVHNMVNVDGGVNEGGNCSREEGCDGVQLTIIIVSGNEMLMKASTIYTKS